MNVVCTRFFVDKDLEYLKNALPEANIIVPDAFDDAGLELACKEGVDVFLGPPPSEFILSLVSDNLKFIQIPWAGVENIDFSACNQFNVPCYNSHSNAPCVAELAVGLFFSILKKIPFHHSELQKGKWHRPGDSEGFYPPILLQGMNVGYFGFGQINQHIKKMLSGFNVNHKAYVNNYRTIDDIDVYSSDNLNKFVADCDVIFIGAPLTKTTESLFDENLLSLMKKGSYLVNISRAKIVSELALTKALSSNLAGAAMDVWYDYPCRGDSRSYPCSDELLSCDNLIVSPHRAGYVAGVLPHLLDVVDNIINANNVVKLKNKINLKDKY